ncbi:MAG: hypothetical protein GY809_09670 [Planctomycetes bacterium]|nr:hypothetical protein [Planctomycetota bacterium]
MYTRLCGIVALDRDRSDAVLVVEVLLGRCIRVIGGDEVVLLRVPVLLSTYGVPRVDLLGLVREVERWDEAVPEGMRVGANLLTGVGLVREVILVRDRELGADRCTEDLCVVDRELVLRLDVLVRV